MQLTVMGRIQLRGAKVAYLPEGSSGKKSPVITIAPQYSKRTYYLAAADDDDGVQW